MIPDTSGDAIGAAPPPAPPRGGNSKRRGARRIALEALYEHDLAGRPLAEILERYAGRASMTYARALVDGVGGHAVAIDALIEASARDWSVSRMPPIDRNLLRLGVLELVWLHVPAGVAIDEAVELAKQYSTADSGRFINGILSRIARDSAAV